MFAATPPRPPPSGSPGQPLRADADAARANSSKDARAQTTLTKKSLLPLDFASDEEANAWIQSIPKGESIPKSLVFSETGKYSEFVRTRIAQGMTSATVDDAIGWLGSTARGRGRRTRRSTRRHRRARTRARRARR